MVVVFKSKIRSYGSNRKHIEVPANLKNINTETDVIVLAYPELHDKFQQIMRKIEKEIRL